MDQADLIDKRRVSEGEARLFAAEVNIPFLETSAKDSTNVEAAFITMAREVKQRMAKSGPEQAADDVDMKGPPPKKKCC